MTHNNTAVRALMLNGVPPWCTKMAYFHCNMLIRPCRLYKRLTVLYLKSEGNRKRKKKKGISHTSQWFHAGMVTQHSAKDGDVKETHTTHMKGKNMRSAKLQHYTYKTKATVNRVKKHNSLLAVSFNWNNEIVMLPFPVMLAALQAALTWCLLC